MKKTLYRLYSSLTNNIIVNNLLILLRLEKIFSHTRHRYKNHKIDRTLSSQEIAGFSIRPEIDQYLAKSHSDLQKTVSKFFPDRADILEIGCGPGLYLKDFDLTKYKLFALDITEDMITLAKKENPSCVFYQGNFIDIELSQKFDFIYTIGVLMYIPRTQLRLFFKKLHGSLNKNGIAYINYPHAISFIDTLYPDLTYIQYSPALVEKISAEYFTVISHQQAFDGREIKAFDKTPYKSENPLRSTTYKNSSLLIIQKNESR